MAKIWNVCLSERIESNIVAVSLLLILSVSTVVAADGGGDRKGEKGETEKIVYILTVDGTEESGVMVGFEQGYLILSQKEKNRRLEISPSDVEAVFSRKEDAKKAKSDREWLRERVGEVRNNVIMGGRDFQAEKKRDPEYKRPPRPGDGDRKGEQDFSERDDRRDKHRPKPKDDDKSVEDLEKEYFSARVPEERREEERFFEDCAEKAKRIADEYSKKGYETFHKLREDRAAKVSAYKDEARLLLEAKYYRDFLLVMAISAREAKMLLDAIPDIKDEKMREKTHELLRDLRETTRKFVERHGKAVQDSKLLGREKMQIIRRQGVMHQVLGLKPPKRLLNRRRPLASERRDRRDERQSPGGED